MSGIKELSDAMSRVEKQMSEDMNKLFYGDQPFGGSPPPADQRRLKGQLLATFNIVKDGEWHSLSDITNAVGGTTTGVSARLRDLRKDKFGSHTIERRHIGGGIWQYRMVQWDAPNPNDYF